MVGICKEIRRAAFLLHEQGIYPGARQVFNVLTDPHVLRAKVRRSSILVIAVLSILSCICLPGSLPTAKRHKKPALHLDEHALLAA